MDTYEGHHGLASDRSPVGAGWHKSSYCAGADTTCVEVLVSADSVSMRDSKDVSQAAITVSRQQWTDFVSAVKAGRFDV